ncbi:MAG: DAK2 domain-containing protein [Chloroflexi bacterium]|nr:DAK2 domain-containing protein [Chloroflexota bacterium]
MPQDSEYRETSPPSGGGDSEQNLAVRDGSHLRRMFAAATRCLERNVEAINAINVFPVPDGDTGTNMLLTMRSALREAESCSEEGASPVARALAQGALMGARGNSGVILSQILSGLARSMDGKVGWDGRDLARGLGEGTSAAYKALIQPVEGTILTVIRDTARAVQDAVNQGEGDAVALMEVATATAKEAVARTPSLLPLLKEAGVVDAGGQGLYLLLDGARRYLKGDDTEPEPEEKIPLRPPILHPEENPFGYCTEFIVQGQALNREEISQRLTAMGQSLLVAGDGNVVRIHIHTLDPGAVLSHALSLGSLHQVKVDNMTDQHAQFLALRRKETPLSLATVAVASGAGLMGVFRGLGATAVVSGGATMNPSVEELWQAVEAVTGDQVVLLPNEGNIIAAARRVPELTKKEVVVIPTRTIPQGVAALLAVDYNADFATNLQAMERAMASIRTAELAIAVRDSHVGALSIRAGQVVALLDGDLKVVADEPIVALRDSLAQMGAETGEVITLYYGADTDSEAAEKAAQAVREEYPGQQVELVWGGQPHNLYIVSVE